MLRFRASYTCVLCLPFLTSAFTASAQITTININGSALQTGVKRLGINLGAVNSYDSGQMLKNLVVNNPSFEGQIAQSMIMCGSGTINSCTDSNGYTGWPADYWDGATYTFVYGSVVGRSGTISTYTTSTTYGTPSVFNFSDATGPAPSSGDYMIVKKVMPGRADEGWSVITGGNGSFATNTTDLPPGTLGVQTIALNAPNQGDNATLTYYFDGTASETFLQLTGTYTLSFKAKATGGSNSLYVNLQRLNYPASVYVQETVALTNNWQTFTIPFSGTDTGATIGTAELQFVTAAPGLGYPASSFELDDVSLVQTNNQDPTNTTVFRDPVVNTLKQLNPGVLRFWYNQQGETLDNFLAPDTGRQRSAFSGYGANGDINTPFVEYSLPEFLQLCQVVGSGSSSPIEPWVVIPITLSTTEASNLIDYLAGPATSVYGAKRAAAGQTAPWTSVFPKIHLEFGNEAWNNLFYGGSMTNGQAYGTRGQVIFAAMKSNANYSAAAFDLMLNGTAYNPGGESTIQYYCNNNDTFAAQPYLILNANDPNSSTGLTTPAAIENLFGSTFAEAEAFVTNSGTAEGIADGLVLQNQLAVQNSGRPVPFAVTETNISPYGGSITQAELDSYISSVGAGLAVTDSMLQNMRIGVLTQNLFALPGWKYYRQDGKSMYLFGSVVDMGVTNLQRPQFLAEQVANNAIGTSTTMLQTTQTGLNPTWNQASINSVQLNNVHYLQSFAFSGGDSYSLIIVNTNRSAGEQVNFGGANIPGGTVQMTQLTSANITDTNETANVVAPVSSTLSNFNAAAGMTLPPFSMTVLTWSAPAISNVAVSSITGTSATITWTTDTASTTQVNYGTTSAYGLQSPLSTTLSTSHSVTLTGLSAGTIYDFTVSSTNAAGATAGSGNITFGTPASFTISAQATVAVQQGSTATVPVTVTPTNGYTGSVTLSVTGLPVGVTATFQTGAGSAALLINASTAVTAATYSLTITGTAGSTVLTAPLSLVVSPTSTTSVSLASGFNIYGIFNNGSAVTNGGLDGASYAYSSNLLGSSLTLGIPYSFGSPGSANAASSTTVPLPAGNYATLSFLGTGVNGNQTSQTFSVTYADGTTSTFTQSMSDWGSPQSYPGEIVASAMAYRVTPTGGEQGGPWNLYAYSFALNSAKAVRSFTLPNSRNVTVLAVTLSGQLSNPQTISFGAVATQTVGTTLALTATASSGLGISYMASPGSVCTVSGAAASLVGAGTCTITASQAGNAAYAAATPVSQSFIVESGQSITFGGIGTQTVGIPLTLTATASSGLPISYAASPSPVCTVTGTSVSFADSGTCTITASQAGNSAVAGAAPVSQSIAVQTVAASNSMMVSLGSTANIYALFNDGTAVTNGGLEGASYAYSANLLGTGVTFEGIPYSFGTPGTATALAYTTLALPTGNFATLNFLGTGVYGEQSAQTFAVTYTDGTTSTFTQGLSDWGTASSNAGEITASTMAYRLTPSGSQQSGPWHLYAYSFALNSGKMVKSLTLPNNRNVTVLAVTLSGQVTLTPQTVTFGAIAGQTVGTSLALTATASSGLAVSYAASPSSVCTASGTAASFVAAGTCTITASQAGSGTYAAATPVSQSFTVVAAQTITFGSISAQTAGTTLALTGTASSGLTVSYAASPSAVCTVSGATASFVAAGNCTITASQAGNSTYAAAMSVAQTFTVSAAALKAQTITFGAILAQTAGTTLALTGTASSGLTVTYAASPSAVCTVSGATASLVAAGNCTITASQAGNSIYAAATPATQTFTVSAAALKAQTITFGAISAQTVGTPLTLTAAATSGLVVTYNSSTTTICTVSGSTATLAAAGTCTITASQAGNTSYAAATPVSQSFTVSAAALKTQTITFGSIGAQTVGKPLTLTASASSGLAVTFASSTTGICTVSGTTATFVSAGTCTIIASQAGNTSYAAATPVSQSVTVNAASTTVSLASSFNVYGIFANGSPVTNGGLDSASYAYSSTLLGSSLTAGGVPFTLGSVGKADAVSSAKVALPSGSYSKLNFLATGVFGSQSNQRFTVTYTDGTTTIATQSLSDWGNPQSFSGESITSKMAYRLTSTGSQQAGPWYVYEYSIALNAAKTVQSITLPSNRSVVVLAITLSH